MEEVEERWLPFDTQSDENSLDNSGSRKESNQATSDYLPLRGPDENEDNQP